MIDKPFCGEPHGQTECVDDILERVTEVTMRGIYKRLRLMGANMDCQNLTDVLLTMLDVQDILNAEAREASELPGMGEIAPNGRAVAYGKRTKRKKHYTPDTMPTQRTIFEDIDHNAPLDKPLEDWEGEYHDTR